MKKAILVIVVLAAAAVAAWRFWPAGDLTGEMLAEFTDATLPSELGDEMGQLRLACARRIESQDWQSAVDACSRMIKKDPHNAFSHYVKSAALFELNKPQDALEELEAGHRRKAIYVYLRRCYLDQFPTEAPEIILLIRSVKKQAEEGTGLEGEGHVSIMDSWVRAGRRISGGEPPNMISFATGLTIQRLAAQGKAAKLRELGRDEEAAKADGLAEDLQAAADMSRAVSRAINAACRDRARAAAIENEVLTYGYVKSIESSRIEELILELDRIWQRYEQ